MNNLKSFCKLLLFSFIVIAQSIAAMAQAQLLVPPSEPTIEAAEIPTSYDVSATGGFTYSVPIDVPPGIHGLIPNLAIVYSSQGGNGLLGMGWSLSGASTITRANSTIFHDNRLDPVDFDGNDVLMLDGQRLIPTGNGKYMTEIKNFANITPYGTAGDGPQGFYIEYPNGLVYDYGSNSQSRLLAAGKQDVLIWGLSRISDKNGNYIDFSYYSDQTQGEFRLTSITYTGNISSNVPTNSIYFNYVNRSDNNRIWVSGSLVQDAQVLDQIVIYHNDNSEAATYRFSYDSDFYTHLTKIEEVRPGNIALPPIKIKWGQNASDEAVTTKLALYTGTNLLPFNYTMGDFNGDGATDCARLPIASSISDIEFFLSDKKDDLYFSSTSSVNFTGLEYSAMQRDGDRWSKISMDYNGDGYDDIVMVEIYQHPTIHYWGLRMHLYLAKPTGGFDSDVLILDYSNSSTHDGRYYTKETRVLPGDFDGDGKRDFMVLIPYDLTHGDEGQMFNCFIVGHAYQGGVYLPNLGNYGALTAGGHHRFIGRIDHEIFGNIPMDYDGDGKTDLLTTSNGYGFLLRDCEIYTMNPSFVNGIVSSAGNISLLYTDTYPSHKTRISRGVNYFSNIYTGDFNGDGKDDILTWTPSATSGYPGLWEIGYSTGIKDSVSGVGGWVKADSGTTLPLQSNELYNKGPWYHYNWSYQVADFNGDGKEDIIQCQDAANFYCEWCGGPGTNNIYNVYYSKGVGKFEKSFGTLPNAFTMDPTTQFLGDFNGDGQVDILCDNGYTPKPLIVYFRKNDKRHIVTSIEHAGKSVNVLHKSLAEYGAPYFYLPWTVNGHSQREYPYISKVIPLKVVTSLEDNISLKTEYEYQTLSIHLTGLGVQGFHEMRIKDISDPGNEKLTKNQYSLFPQLWGTHGAYGRAPVICTTTVYVQHNGGWEASWSKRFSYVDEDGGAGGKVRIFKNYGTIETNFATGEYTDIHTNFVPGGAGTIFYEFGQPNYVEESRAVHNGYITDRSTFTYNMGSSFINRSKPISVLKDITYPGKPVYSRITEYQYNSQGLLAKKRNDPGTANQTDNDYSYDVFGNMYSSILSAPLSSPSLPAISKNWDYTSDGRFVKKTREYHWGDTYNDENVQINNWGKVTESKDRSGLTTKFEYDFINRLTKTENPDGTIDRTIYNWAYNNATDNPSSSFSNYAVITANNGAAQFFVEEKTDGITGSKFKFFDFYKRKIRDAYPGFDGQTIYSDAVYKNSGLMDYSVSPYPASNPSVGVTNTHAYNYLNLETGMNTSEGTGSSSIYDVIISPSRLETTTINSGGRQKVTYADAEGVYKIEDDGIPIEHFFNSNGHPNETVINNDQNLKTSYQYDNYGRCVSKTEPNAGTTTYVYNAYDQLTSETTNGVTYNYTYDVMGRVTEKKQAGQSVGYTHAYYNTAGLPNTGKPMMETSPYGTSKQYIYDTLGRLIQLYETVPGQPSFLTEYTYDVMGRMDTRKYPSGHKIQNTYNVYGYLESIDLIAGSANNHKLWQATSKDHLGNTTQAQYFDQLSAPLYTLDRSFNNLGYEVSNTITNVNSNIVSAHTYNFNMHTGNLDMRTDKYAHTENFTYDNSDRLIAVNGFGAPMNLTYSDEGNILRKNNVTQSGYDWKYNKYALEQVPEPQTSDPAYMLPQDTQTVTYFPFKQVKDIAEQRYKIAFTYGSDNQRCKAEYLDIVNPATPVLLQERYYASSYQRTVNAASGNVEELSYISDGNDLIAVLKKETTLAGTSGGIYYIGKDHLGSITEVLDDEGVNNNGLVEERSYDVWGRPRDPMNYMAQTPGTAPNWMFDRGYTGHEHLWLKGQFDFGIINMNGRLYDPVLGRMFSPDPAVTDNTSSDAYNKYAYANNNPLKYSDPSGNVFVVPLLLYAMFTSGAVNMASNAGNIHNFADGILSFYLGAGEAAAGAAFGGMVGGLVKGNAFFTGAASGLAGGAAGGFVGGAATGGFSAGLKSGVISGLMGAVTGGFAAGLNAAEEGRAFFTGQRIGGDDGPRLCYKSTGAPYGNVVEDKNGMNFVKGNYALKRIYDRILYKPTFVTGGKESFIGTEETLKYNLKKDVIWGVTDPPNQNYFSVGSATIYINPVAFDGDKTLFLTIQHELFHAAQVSDGTLALLTAIHSGNTDAAITHSEHGAYQTNLNTTLQWWGPDDFEYYKVKINLINLRRFDIHKN